MSSINHEIDKQAACWAAKRDLQSLSPEEEAEFDAWLAADVRHLGAYGRAEAVLCRLDRLSAAALDRAPGDTAENRGLSRRRMVVAGAATAAAAAFVGIAPLDDGVTEETYSAQFGQMREVILSDGSVVSLNTDSKISVSFTDEARNVQLERGEALFDVAKNKRRPFTVFAGDTRVRAVGTSFSVSRLPQKPIEILVKEGIVELQRTNAPEALPVRATANIQVIASADAPIVTMTMPQEKLSRELEWQYGRIALDNETLADAAAEFARYSDVHIVVDPAISNRTVTGLFASNDPVGFARAAASVLKLQIEMKGDEVRIFEG
jgi:transmembrane sensor